MNSLSKLCPNCGKVTLIKDIGVAPDLWSCTCGYYIKESKSEIYCGIIDKNAMAKKE